MIDLELSRLHAALEETFAGNFVAYYRAHIAHINVTGRFFLQDHELLQKIYDSLQENIDTLGEKIRTTKAFAPRSLSTVIGISPIMDMDVDGNAEDLLEGVEDSIEALIDQYKDLYMAAEDVGYVDISNYAQDQIGILAKFKWMLESTLDERQEEEGNEF